MLLHCICHALVSQHSLSLHCQPSMLLRCQVGLFWCIDDRQHGTSWSLQRGQWRCDACSTGHIVPIYFHCSCISVLQACNYVTALHLLSVCVSALLITSACMFSSYTAAAYAFEGMLLQYICHALACQQSPSAQHVQLIHSSPPALFGTCCCIVFALHLCLRTPHQLSKHFQLTHSILVVLVRACCCIAFAMHLCLGTPCQLNQHVQQVRQQPACAL